MIINKLKLRIKKCVNNNYNLSFYIFYILLNLKPNECLTYIHNNNHHEYTYAYQPISVKIRKETQINVTLEINKSTLSMPFHH